MTYFHRASCDLVSDNGVLPHRAPDKLASRDPTVSDTHSVEGAGPAFYELNSEYQHA